jgi:CheY-like chemotaxis protein
MKNETAAIKQKLLGITDLNVEKIKEMTDDQLKNYIEFLSTSVNIFSMQKEKLKHAFDTMDYASVIQWMKIIRNSLSRIYADNLVKDCEKQIELNHDLENIRHEKLRVVIDYFLSTLTMFFADIQKLLEEQGENDHKHASRAEKIKEKLSALTELNARKIKTMTDEQLSNYIRNLNAFPDEFQGQENALRNALKIKHYAFVMQSLSAIEDSLSKIHADDLLEECRNQININKDYNSIRHEKLEAFVNYFLTSLSMLAEDIKMLRLPKQKQESDAAEAPVEIELTSPGASPDAKSILAVNKIKIFLKNLENALKNTGHELIGVTSSDAALQYLRSAKPDLFILDDSMPGIDGYEFTKKIRQMGQMAPIIFTTGNLTKKNMDRLLAAGVADFIVKPIATPDVQKKVAKYLLQ